MSKKNKNIFNAILSLPDKFKNAFFKKHKTVELNIFIMSILSFLVVLIGGIVEIVPLYTIKTTIEKVEGVTPYTPLELAGRNIYVREGCYTCHSQQIRTFFDEQERYGHYSIAAESMYDRPFQWGSKRTGPDVARVGKKYSNQWHTAHMVKPQTVVPESIMPGYPFLLKKEISGDTISSHLKTLKFLGTPYSKEQIKNARNDLILQANPEFDTEEFEERYPNALIADFDGQPNKLTEMDALIAYLQSLGTKVDFSEIEAKDLKQ